MIQPAEKPKTKAKKAPKEAPKNSVAIKGQRGLPPHVPSQATRNLVLLGLAMGQSQDQVARLVGISLSTMQKYYQEELADGGQKILTGIAGNLARIAQDPNHPKCVTAAIFWLKTKGGFKEAVATVDEPVDDRVTFTINIGGSGPPKPEPKVIDA